MGKMPVGLAAMRNKQKSFKQERSDWATDFFQIKGYIVVSPAWVHKEGGMAERANFPCQGSVTISPLIRVV